jgi:hypothetical protein
MVSDLVPGCEKENYKRNTQDEKRNYEINSMFLGRNHEKHVKKCVSSETYCFCWANLENEASIYGQVRKNIRHHRQHKANTQMYKPVPSVCCEVVAAWPAFPCEPVGCCIGANAIKTMHR